MKILISNDSQLLELFDHLPEERRACEFQTVPVFVIPKKQPEEDGGTFLNINDLPLQLSNYNPKIEIRITKENRKIISESAELLVATNQRENDLFQMSIILSNLNLPKKVSWLNISAPTLNNIYNSLKKPSPLTEVDGYLCFLKARRQLDWYYSMSMSILYTSVMTFDTKRKMVSIGVEKLYVFNAIIECEAENEATKSTTYDIELDIETSQGNKQTLIWSPSQQLLNDKNQMVDGKYAKKIMNGIKSKQQTIKVAEHVIKEIENPAPGPLNKNALILAIIKKHPSVNNTQLSQALGALYEKRMILNPDAQTRSYNTSLLPLGNALIKEVIESGHPCSNDLSDKPQSNAFKQPPTPSTSGALIPMIGSVKKAKGLKGLEKLVYSLIIRYFMSQYAPNEVKSINKVMFETSCGQSFLLKWVGRKSSGWKSVLLTSALPEQDGEMFSKGDELKINNCRVVKVDPVADKKIMLDRVIKKMAAVPLEPLAALNRLSNGKKKYIEQLDSGEIMLTEDGAQLRDVFAKYGNPAEILKLYYKGMVKAPQSLKTCEKFCEQVKSMVDIHVKNVSNKIKEKCKGLTRCNACENGYMLKMSKEKSEFYGCSNFPNCKNTESVSSIDGR